VRSLFGRGGAVAVTVSPTPLRPGDELTATVVVPSEIEKVAAAKAELGYLNTYAYRWAGRADAAATAGADSLATIGQVGTDYGSERETADWVGVVETPLAITDDALAAGTRELPFRVPSWAPASSEKFVTWAVRLTVDRKGRDIEADGAFVVLAPAPADGHAPGLARHERVMGGSSDIEIHLDRPAWRAGETMSGTVVITAPAEGLPEADVVVVLQLDRLSHPLERTPARAVTFERGLVSIDKHVALTAGGATELPFALPLPPDAGPTAEAVHSSLEWFVGVRIFYKGFSAHLPERVRRGFVVFND